MIQAARRLALGCNAGYCACLFLTVDAGIEHDKGVRTFLNSKLYNKNRKTISMCKNLYR
jgi:hypothetical protein